MMLFQIRTNGRISGKLADALEGLFWHPAKSIQEPPVRKVAASSCSTVSLKPSNFSFAIVVSTG